MVKSVVLFSGGLDSTLAILTIMKQGIEVKAIKFRTPFDISQIHPYPPFLKEGGVGIINFQHYYEEMDVAQKFGFDIEIHYLGDIFIDIVKQPRFGYGKNMNPCIDCRILMLKEAKILMNKIGADFIVTGEVLGQRPMSQRRDTFYLVDREAGVRGYVLRPLSAKLLEITIPESKGIVNREELYNFSGRTRRPQITLAREFGLSSYPSPAGGCLLTEPHYAHRLKDLLIHSQNPCIRDIKLLKTGRHFRFSPQCKIIVGRDKKENEILESLAGSNDCLITIEGYGSPTTLVSGILTDEALRVATSLCARYSDAKDLSDVEAKVICLGNRYNIRTSSARNEIIEGMRIDRFREKDRVKA